ncbi:MAG: dehydrogenase [Desulfobacterales bacterium]|nr:dehydrogenase [Desulfobacterales bacterium]
MKEVVCISKGSSADDYEFQTEFLGHSMHIQRIGADGDFDKVADIMLRWNKKADAIGLASIQFPFNVGNTRIVDPSTKKLYQLSQQMETPVTTGENFRRVSHEWTLRHIQHKFGDNYFNNSRVFFISGIHHYSMAKVMEEYTQNLTFADPVIDKGIPKFINSTSDLELYAKGIHGILKWVPSERLAKSAVPIKTWNDYIVKKAVQKSFVIVVPSYKFYDHLKSYTVEELGRKIIITSTAYDDRIQFLKERGVDAVIDTTPKILERVVGLSVYEAMIIAALEKPQDQVTMDDLLEVISSYRLDPRVVFPSGVKKRINRFAFVIHPLSQEYLKKDKAIDLIAKIAPEQVMDAVEKIIAYSPPFIYSKVAGIKSPTGVEAEGWLITVGGTPKQMLSHKPEFTYKRLLQAAQMAKRLGAQIMGLGAFTKVVGDAGITVAKLASIPITTGNSYSASGALWAAADAVRRMGLIKEEKGKKIKAKTMVIGATGAIGSVCCRLLAKAFEEVHLVDVRDAKLLALKETLQEENPDVQVHISTRADKFLPDMDVIVTATSAAGKKILDVTKVKPGCVITDVARPLDLSPEDVAKRPDVLYIESGEILLPGMPEMKNIGLPPRVAYACLAETIVLALEGRYEIFTIGREIEWEKVKEIYKMGLKHGMRLAAISGVHGVYSDEDIQRIKELALKGRASFVPGQSIDYTQSEE